MTDIKVFPVRIPTVELLSVALFGAKKRMPDKSEQPPYVSVSPSVVWLTPANSNMAEARIRSNTDWKVD